MRRFSVLLAVALLSTAGLFLLLAGPASANSHTWTSDADFAGGTAAQTVVVGAGAAASIQLQVNPQFNWLNMSPTVAPSPRTGPAMTFNSRAGVVLMFGGAPRGSGFLNDLWTYDTVTNTWTNVTPATNPPARWKAGFSYDPVAQAAFMYGGADSVGNRIDLWKYDVVAGTWTPLTPAPPRPRGMDSSPVVYDSSVGKHVLTGRDSSNGTFTTWLYNASANTWAYKTPGTSPDPRSGHTLSFDRATSKTILFGGAQGLTVFGDWWDYNATSNTWTKLGDFVPNVTPNPRTSHAMTFGPNGAVNLMFGGVDSSSSYPPETWYYVRNGNVWLTPPVGTAPGGRRDHTFAWDSAHDKTVMFAGQLSNSIVTNQTWIWGTGYYNSGTFESATFDAGCAAPDWKNVWWNSTTPATTTVRFKLATSTSAGGPWNFLGPDGLPGTFYTSPGTAVNVTHRGQEFFRWRTYLTTGNVRVTPSMNDFSVNYLCPLAPPQIIATSPSSGATGVLQTADIVVTFNEPMNRSTVTWSFSDGTIVFTSSWNPTSTVLTLSHSAAFRECTSFTAQITGGRDQANNLNLVPGPVPNPWSFTTQCINPFIQSTDPANGTVNVLQTANVIVTFNQAMNTSTVTWTISGGIALTGSWDATETVLTLTHGVAFAPCTVYTARITAGQDKVGLPLVAGPVPNPWSFTTVCANPYIASTNPKAGATGVALNADIVVNFSKAMNIATVRWTIGPNVPHTYTWAPGNATLTLSHTTPFAELTMYTVRITAGNDTLGNPLVPGPVPNPWSFRTVGVNPFITTTNPASGAPSVAANANVIVTFSEGMNKATVSATSTPVVVFTSAWNPTNTTLTLSHAAPFAPCTLYTVRVSGNDTQGLPLVAGPVPNPWSFTVVCALTGPANLRLVLQPPDVVLSWDAVTGATGYNVYSAQNRFAAFPGSWSLLGSPATTSFLAAGHGSDALTHYYLVRATNGALEGPNSSMGAKVELSFGYSSTNTNIAWFSLPYRSAYVRASDIATALGPLNIDVVGKWDPARQSSLVYYYARNGWRGTDFTIGAGDGLFLGVKRAFTWTVVGTDRSALLTFTLNGGSLGNVNWLSVPYTGVYSRASSITNELTSTKIVEVGLWNPVTQTVVRYYWSGTWTGTDFTISPGAGVYLIIASSFTWTPSLITPAVP